MSLYICDINYIFSVYIGTLHVRQLISPSLSLQFTNSEISQNVNIKSEKLNYILLKKLKHETMHVMR